MPLQNALFLFITDTYIRGWTLAMSIEKFFGKIKFDIRAFR